jgi:hypothetical protein
MTARTTAIRYASSLAWARILSTIWSASSLVISAKSFVKSPRSAA